MSRARDHEVVVLGGGPAGTSAACLLARKGHAPLLIERDAGPRHKVCGEFLSVEAQADLAGLGIEARALGAASISKVRLVHGRRTAEARLPFEGLGLTRRTMDEALLRHAAAGGARLRRGVVAREIVQEGSGLAVLLRGGETVRAQTVFLATGKHDLHHPKRPSGTSGSDLIGFKTYFGLAPAQRRGLQDAVEIVLFDGGYAGLQSVEAGMANLCLLVRRTLFAKLGGRWDALVRHLCRVSPHLRTRLDGAAALLAKPLSIANVPYGFVHHGTASQPEGLFHVGDQMGVIPSFSGDGIAIALHTARVAVDTYVDRGNAAALAHARLSNDLKRQIRLASALQGFGQAWLGRVALTTAFRLWPDALTALAAWTRIEPEQGAVRA